MVYHDVYQEPCGANNNALLFFWVLMGNLMGTKDGQLAISDIQAITQANRNTIKVRLRELVDHGYLIKHGKGKGTFYLPGDNSA